MKQTIELPTGELSKETLRLIELSAVVSSVWVQVQGLRQDMPKDSPERSRFDIGFHTLAKFMPQVFDALWEMAGEAQFDPAEDDE